jgi:hypothetical protein
MEDYDNTQQNKQPIITPQTITLRDNPYKKWIYLAQVIDSWRIFPRIFLTVYVVILYQVVNWFMLLENPNFEQSTLVSVVIGAGAAWFGVYTNGAPRISKE